MIARTHPRVEGKNIYFLTACGETGEGYLCDKIYDGEKVIKIKKKTLTDPETVSPNSNPNWTHSCGILRIGHTTIASDDGTLVGQNTIDCTLRVRLASDCTVDYSSSASLRWSNHPAKEELKS